MLRVSNVQRVSTDDNGDVIVAGALDPVFSPDGTKVMFTSSGRFSSSDVNNDYNSFIKDLNTGEVTIVDSTSSGIVGNRNSSSATFSNDGTKVIFTSSATNLAAGDTAVSDIFIKDLDTGSVSLVSRNAVGEQGNSFSFDGVLSPDGNHIAFASHSTNLISSDENGMGDIFLKNLSTGAVSRINTDSNGVVAAPIGSNHTLHSVNPVFSPDGSKVAFVTAAQNLVAGDTNLASDIFIKDLNSGNTTRVSTSSTGGEGNSNSSDYAFSPDGTKLAFVSSSSNLVDGDVNARDDIFIKDLITGETTRISVDDDGVGGTWHSTNPVFSPDGTKIAFSSGANNFATPEGRLSIFVKDLNTGETVAVHDGSRLGEDITPSWSSDGNKIIFSVGDIIGNTGAYTVDLGKILRGTSGDDLINGGDGFDLLRGYAGNDTLNGNNGNDDIYGEAGTDTLNGGNGNDSIRGGDESDNIHGDEGDDFLRGNMGNDVMFGGEGNDKVYGDENDDALYGNNGNDILKGGDGNDSIFGQNDDDLLVGNVGDDFLISGNGNDKAFGGDGEDTIAGGTGNDTLRGGNDNDRLNGNDDDDRLYADAGNDTLDGGDGNDRLNGGDGIDILYGGDGLDLLVGGTGADIFSFSSLTDSGVSDDQITVKSDRIFDFNQTEGDVIDLIGFEQMFTFIGNAAFSGTEGEIRYEQQTFDNGYQRTLVRIDVDGNGASDMDIQFSQVHIDFTVSDFDFI